MPIYEYGCSECGHQFEEEQRIKDAPLRKCPQCGQDRLERLISATAFVLKGGGWYKDGYGDSGKKRTENDRADSLQKAVDNDKKSATSSESTETKLSA